MEVALGLGPALVTWGEGAPCREAAILSILACNDGGSLLCMGAPPGMRIPIGPPMGGRIMPMPGGRLTTGGDRAVLGPDAAVVGTTGEVLALTSVG